MSQAAYEAMRPWLTEEYGNPSQPYAHSRGPRGALQRAREITAACIGASPEEIYFTSGGTESDNWVIQSCAENSDGREGIITSAFEHHAVLNSCLAVERKGTPVRFLQPDTHGFISVKKLQTCLSIGTRLVSIMYANNELGTIQPIPELSAAAHHAGALFHTDAVQAIGHIPVNVNAAGVDVLSASAHKFNGPRGIGFLYIRRGVKLAPLLHGGKQEGGMRAGTENVAAAAGMAAALKENTDNLTRNEKHLFDLETAFLASMREYRVQYHRNGHPPFLPGFFSLSFPGLEGETILHRMDLMGISISTGAACDSERIEISHVLKSIGLSQEEAVGTVRITFGVDNSIEDAAYIGKALSTIVRE